jgi:HJR/Mrr/RecB family endonuclease
MKRKIFHLNNIEVITPSNKRIKLNHIKITLKNKMTTQEFSDELKELLQERPYSSAQPLPKKGYDSLEENSLSDQSDSDFKDSIYDTSDESIVSYDSNIEQDNESISSHDTIKSDDDNGNQSQLTDEQVSSQVSTPKHSTDKEKYKEEAIRLQKLQPREKGEAQELAIKELLEKQGFMVTKTQSSTKKGQIIGDNGADHIAQIKIRGEIIRMVIQSKNWAGELANGVVRELQGTIAEQYPQHIGIIVINGGGMPLRTRNAIKDSKRTMLIYNIEDLYKLKRDLRNLQRQDKLVIYSQTLETMDKVKITEKRGRNVIKTTKGKNYRKHTVY